MKFILPFLFLTLSLAAAKDENKCASNEDSTKCTTCTQGSQCNGNGTELVPVKCLSGKTCKILEAGGIKMALCFPVSENPTCNVCNGDKVAVCDPLSKNNILFCGGTSPYLDYKCPNGKNKKPQICKKGRCVDDDGHAGENTCRKSTVGEMVPIPEDCRNYGFCAPGPEIKLKFVCPVARYFNPNTQGCEKLPYTKDQYCSGITESAFVPFLLNPAKFLQCNKEKLEGIFDCPSNTFFDAKEKFCLKKTENTMALLKDCSFSQNPDPTSTVALTTSTSTVTPTTVTPTTTYPTKCIPGDKKPDPNFPCRGYLTCSGSVGWESGFSCRKNYGFDPKTKKCVPRYEVPC